MEMIVAHRNTPSAVLRGAGKVGAKQGRAFVLVLKKKTKLCKEKIIVRLLTRKYKSHLGIN